MLSAGKRARRFGYIGIACCVLGECIVVAAADAANGEAENVAAPRFDWGPELQASVIAVRTFSPDLDMKVRYRLRAARSSGGYDLTATDIDVPADQATGADEALLAGLLLHYHIAEKGEFKGIREFEALRERVEVAYRKKYAAEMAERPEAVERAVRYGSSADVLQSEAARTWSSLVSSWIGRTVVPGQPQTEQARVNWVLIDEPVLMQTKFYYSGPQACSKSDLQQSCVRLRSVSTPDASEFAKGLDRFIARFGGAPVSQGLVDMDVQLEVELLTEPNTLRPHWARWTKRGSVTTREDDGNEKTAQSVDSTTMTFSYDATVPSRR